MWLLLNRFLSSWRREQKTPHLSYKANHNSHSRLFTITEVSKKFSQGSFQSSCYNYFVFYCWQLFYSCCFFSFFYILLLRISRLKKFERRLFFFYGVRFYLSRKEKGKERMIYPIYS